MQHETAGSKLLNMILPPRTATFRLTGKRKTLVAAAAGAKGGYYVCSARSHDIRTHCTVHVLKPMLYFFSFHFTTFPVRE